MNTKPYVIKYVLIIILFIFLILITYQIINFIRLKKYIPECNFLKTSNSIIIDFSECARCTETVTLPSGYMSFGFYGTENEKCIFKYKQKLNEHIIDDAICKIPIEIGERIFNISEFGIKFSPILKYCEKPVETL